MVNHPVASTVSLVAVDTVAAAVMATLPVVMAEAAAPGDTEVINNRSLLFISLITIANIVMVCLSPVIPKTSDVWGFTNLGAFDPRFTVNVQYESPASAVHHEPLTLSV